MKPNVYGYVSGRKVTISYPVGYSPTFLGCAVGILLAPPLVFLLLVPLLLLKWFTKLIQYQSL